MIDIIRRPIKKRRKKERRHHLAEKGPEAFRPTRENQLYLTNLYNKSEFINRAISFYIMLINNPMQILKELKRRHPMKYKLVGRKKFQW